MPRTGESESNAFPGHLDDRPASPGDGGGVTWEAVDAGRERPPLDARLSDWDVWKRRPSHLNARRSFRGRAYHLKWFRRRLFGNPARREFLSAKRVEALGIRSVIPVGWGRHPGGTFVVLEGSPGAPIHQMRERPPTEVLEDMARELADMAARLHDANLCHRDLYVDHVLIDGPTIRLIDLDRARPFRRRRWIVKDLGGLLFSTWRHGVPPHLARLFLRVYLETTARRWNRRRLLRAIQRKARAYLRHNTPG